MKTLWLSFLLTLTSSGLIAPLTQARAAVESYTSTVRGAPLVAIYRGKGASKESLRSFKMFLQETGFSYVTVTAQQVQNGVLHPSIHRFLYMPGGYAKSYDDALGVLGAQKIKDYVSAGGGYLGICAGAFYAAHYAEGIRDGKRATYELGIGLFEGVAFDGTQAGLKEFKHGLVDFELARPVQGRTRFEGLLIGGPAFKYDPQYAADHQLKVVARFAKSQLPAIITYRYGAGRVFLSAPHIEIDVNEAYMGFGAVSYGFDSERDWGLLLQEGALFVSGYDHP